MKRYKDVVKPNIAPKSKFGTNPSDPWSAKAGLAEGRNTILKKFILSKGIDPKMLSGDSMIAYSKSLEFQKWASDRKLRGEAVESPTLLSQKRLQSKLNKHKVIHTVGGLGEDLNEAVDRKDTVTINIPLLIRLLELAREDVKTDMELHHIVERLINIRNRGVLSMDHYNYIAGKSRKVFREETDLDDYDTIANIKESVSDWGNYTVHTSTGKHTVYGPSDDHAEMTKHLHRQMGGHGKIIYGDIKKIEPHTDAVANTRDPKSNRSYNESIIDEMSGANMDTREVHQHLKKGGWKLSRSTGGHDVFTHPDSDEHIPVPRHRQLKAPLILSILKTAKKRTGVTEDKFQDPNAATQTTGMEVESKASKLIKSLRKDSTMREELYDWEKEDKSVQSYGKKPKFGKPNPNSKSNLAAEKSVSRAVMSGGTTLTGETRDDVEIDPMMKNRPNVPMDDKKKVIKTKI
jgi:predicted RNA binding protein YcfA (HicA-like mRNA interferase family)